MIFLSKLTQIHPKMALTCMHLPAPTRPWPLIWRPELVALTKVGDASRAKAVCDASG